MSSFIEVMVTGTTWKARMDNGAVFEVWTPFVWKRKKATENLLIFANAVIFDTYDKSSIENVWKTKGKSDSAVNFAEWLKE